MRAAQSKIHEQLTGSSKHHSRRLRGDQRLKVQNVNESGFQQLRLGQWRGHAQDWLVGKKYRPLRHRMHVSSEAKLGKVVEQSFAKSAAACQPVYILGRKPDILEEGKRLFEPRRDQGAATGWKLAHEEFEDGRLRLAMIQVGLDHIELIEIG